jgi:hypothetical protein
VLWGVSWSPTWSSCGGTTAGGSQQCVVCECGSGAARRRALRGPCVCRVKKSDSHSHSAFQMLRTGVPLSPQRALLSPSPKRVSSPPQRDSKRHKASVGDKLSDATAHEEEPELQLFVNLTTEDGAPPPSYWEGLYDQVKKVGCELDFLAIEELVFNLLLLDPKCMKQAENDSRMGASCRSTHLPFFASARVILKQGSQRRCSSFQCTKIFFHIKRGLRRHSMT